MAVAGTASIFRIDANAETETDAETANETIEFNGGGNPDNQSNLTSLTIHYIEDISIHPNPNRHLSQLQDGKLGTLEVIMRGHFITPDSAGGVAKFNNWMINDKTNASLPYGRFGIRYDNMSQIDLTPSSTIGFILYDVQIDDVEEFQNKANFTAKLYRNGSI